MTTVSEAQRNGFDPLWIKPFRMEGHEDGRQAEADKEEG